MTKSIEKIDNLFEINARLSKKTLFTFMTLQ